MAPVIVPRHPVGTPISMMLCAVVAKLEMTVEPRWFAFDEEGSRPWDRACDLLASQVEGERLRAVYEWGEREVGE